ncbi:MAG: hypothetical protein JWR09_2569 [Mucilaginibacter sp.]|nr:hypothetical protein [Mucilaginibacter sp.]
MYAACNPGFLTNFIVNTNFNPITKTDFPALYLSYNEAKVNYHLLNMVIIWFRRI